MEVLKQDDQATKACVAELVDELGHGVTLGPFDERVGMELARLLHRLQGNPVHPLETLAWSKLSYVLGAWHPTNMSSDADTELLIQKTFFDDMWEMSLTDMFRVMGAGPDLPPSDGAFHQTAKTLNAGNRQHAGEIRSYRQAYRAEAGGGVSLFTPVAVKIMADVQLRATGSAPKLTAQQEEELQRTLQGLLTAGLCKGKFTLDLRTLHVHTSCHAAVRWNKQRLLEANDFYDFHHASAAIGYCQAFFTEHSLKTLVTQKHVGLDEQFNCIVLSDVGEIVDYLMRLRPSSTKS
jgi:hypothetical protein